MSLRIWSDIATKLGTTVDVVGPINIVVKSIHRLMV